MAGKGIDSGGDRSSGDGWIGQGDAGDMGEKGSEDGGIGLVGMVG